MYLEPERFGGVFDSVFALLQVLLGGGQVSVEDGACVGGGFVCARIEGVFLSLSFPLVGEFFANVVRGQQTQCLFVAIGRQVIFARRKVAVSGRF